MKHSKILFTSAFLFSTLAGAQTAPPKSWLLVLAKTDQMLAVIDPVTLKVEAHIPAGGNPHEVIASADGRRAYISNYGNGSLNTITVIDLVARKQLTAIDLGPLYGPHGLTFVGGHLYFTAEREKLIGRIDPVTNKVEWLLGTGQVGTHMLWVAQDQRHIITVGVGSGTIHLIEQRAVVPASELAKQPLSKQGGQTTWGSGGPPAADWDEAVVKVGSNPEGFDVLHDASGRPTAVWVANAFEGTVSVVDVASRSVLTTLDTNIPSANRLRFTPDAKLALISGGTSQDLIVVDVASRKVIKRIAIGLGGAGIVMQPDGARAFISCSPQNAVAVIDLKTLTMTGKLDVGKEPDGEAWAVRGDPNGGVSP